MPFSIDHVVIASDDLDSAVVNAAAAGFTVIPGGEHGSGHTHNALIGFADGSYLELFAPTPQGRSAEHRWFGRIRNGGGLVDFCLLGSDLNTEVSRIHKAGIEYSKPFAMRRVTPDGTRIEWLLSTPPGVTGQHGWPFMIEDKTPRAIRVPHAPGQIRHKNGAQGVAGITVLVQDIDASSRAYEAILRAAPQSSVSLGKRIHHFLINGASIQLREPASSEEQDHFERHGQGPYELMLRNHENPLAPKDQVWLDRGRFSGARIAISW
jgi:hypothetical protein